MTRGTAGSGESSLQSLQENEGCEGNRHVKFRAMEGISNEIREFRLRMRRRWRVLEASEEVCYETST
jgi:hypothetical protein